MHVYFILYVLDNYKKCKVLKNIKHFFVFEICIKLLQNEKFTNKNRW